MRQASAIPATLFFLIWALGSAVAYPLFASGRLTNALWVEVIFLISAILVGAAIKIASQWERAVVLRLGKFKALRGPGLFFIIPIVDVIPYWIDVRVITSTFKAEKTLTKDTVPVDVDAVLFWRVQTALRDVIGKTTLADMLEGREKISHDLGRIIDERSQPWGISVISVELKDVLIPSGLEDAMSMQAQAERERQARIILGDSERQVAAKFQEAARSYANDPTAFHLRAMNMLYEGLKQNSTIVIVPSTAVESMNLGGLAGMTSLGLQLAKPPREHKPAVARRPAAARRAA